jgi:hypothetical protein
MLTRVFRQAELMDRMIQRVGVDPVTVARIDRGMAWYEARTRCIACCNERQCNEWLASPGTVAASEPPEFCHNAELLRRCGKRTRE